MAGVVDQDVDLNAALTETLVQLDDRRNVRQIDLLHDDLDVELLSKRLGDSLKPVQPARDKNQRMALLGILAGELLAKAT